MPGPLEKLSVHAGLRCALGGSAPDLVFIWDTGTTFGYNAGEDAFFNIRVSSSQAQAGNCVTDAPAYGDWSFGSRAGRLVCVATRASARIDWSFDGENLIATAERDDADLSALYEWWLEEGRGILH